MTARPVRLRADDAEGLAVLSALLQDAIIARGDMRFDRDQRRFTLVANRFCWERPAESVDGETIHARTLSALTIDGVDRAQSRELKTADKAGFYVLLALTAESGALMLRLAGGGELRLETAAFQARLEDIGEDWPTGLHPAHKDETA